MAYPNEVYTVFSFLGFLMCLFPLPCYLRASNTCITLYIFWTGTGCLIYCINSIVWNGNSLNSAPIWCEISTRFSIASSFGIPAASLCINRRLYLIQLATGENRIRFNKNRAMAFDLIVGLGLPLLSIPIYYISQGNRFNIFEDIGCNEAIYYSWVALVSLFLPPVLIGCVAAVYAIQSIIAINKMRTRFKQLMMAANSNMTYSLYFRLMALAGIETLCTIPITGTYFIFIAMRLSPWISWEDTHANFDRVEQFPAIVWRTLLGTTGAQMLDLARWLFVVCAVLFFCFFGISEEVRSFYGPAFQSALKRTGIWRGRKSDGIVFKLDSMSSHSPGEKTLVRNIVGDIEIGKVANGL